jgi:hypothetical protein
VHCACMQPSRGDELARYMTFLGANLVCALINNHVNLHKQLYNVSCSGVVRQQEHQGSWHTAYGA